MNGRGKRNSTLFAVAIVITVVLTACGSAVESSGDASQPAGAASQSAGAAPADAARTESQLPADFQIAVYQGEEIVGGQEVQFSELLGQGKPVVLNLWAGLCPPCRLEMSDFQEVSDEFGDEVVLFGLDVGPFTNLGSREDGQSLVQELGVTYPVGTTDEADVVRAYGLIGMPTTYFITPEGEIVQQWTGLLTSEKLSELVEELLEASAGS